MNGRFCYDCRKHVLTPCRSSRDASRCPNYRQTLARTTTTSAADMTPSVLQALETSYQPSTPDPTPSYDSGSSFSGGGGDAGGGGASGDF